MFLNLILKSNFFNFFPLENNFNLINNQNFRQSYLEGNYYLINCFFQNLFTNNFKGGVIFMETLNNANLLIELTNFISINSSVEGGVIYFSCSNNGGLILNKICSSNCISSEQYQFLYSETSNIKNNSIFSSSFSNFYNINNKRYSFYISKGIQNNYGINFTNSKVNLAQIYLEYSSSTSTIFYSNLMNFKCDLDTNIWVKYGTFYFENNNFINNSVGVQNSGMIWGGGGTISLTIKNSNFYNNLQNNIGYLFYSNSGTIYLISNYYDNLLYTQESGIYSISNQLSNKINLNNNYLFNCNLQKTNFKKINFKYILLIISFINNIYVK